MWSCAVITVIEALRAFDIIYVLNTPRKTEVLSILTTNNLLGEGGGNVGRGSGLRHDSLRPLLRLRDLVCHQSLPQHAGRGGFMSAVLPYGPPSEAESLHARARPALRLRHRDCPDLAGADCGRALCVVAAVCRDGSERVLFQAGDPDTGQLSQRLGSGRHRAQILEHGADPGAGADLHALLFQHGGVRLQPILLAVQYLCCCRSSRPAISCRSRSSSSRCSSSTTAVELPIWLSNSGKLNGSTWGLILIHIAFQSGFCTFVLSNYMKLLPKSLNEAARIDGAGVWKQYWQIIMPLTLPALAALATLEFTWIYNDFFWAVVLEQQGADRPITSSLANLGGEFFTDDNLIAAASMFVALPTLIVYFALQRYFIAGSDDRGGKGVARSGLRPKNGQRPNRMIECPATRANSGVKRTSRRRNIAFGPPAGLSGMGARGDWGPLRHCFPGSAGGRGAGVGLRSVSSPLDWNAYLFLI